jgi:hypothetical protein
MRQSYEAAFACSGNPRDRAAQDKKAASDTGAPDRGPADSIRGRGMSEAPSSDALNQQPSGNRTNSSPEKSNTNRQPSGNFSGMGILSTESSVAYGGLDALRREALPIVREQASPSGESHSPRARTAGRLVAEAINRVTGGTHFRSGARSPTPDQLDYVLGQLTGGLGRELLKANQTIAASVTGDQLPPYKIPLVGRLYGNTRGPAGQSERFDENVTLLNELENELKGRMRNREDTEGLRKSEPLVVLIGMGNQTESQISKLRELRRREVERKDAGYQERVKDIDGRMGEAMTRLNTEVARVRTKEAAK